MYEKIKSFARLLIEIFFFKNKNSQVKNQHPIDWPKTQEEFEEFWTEEEAMKNYFEPSRIKFYNEVLQFIPLSYKKILDVGCGNGYFLSKIAKRDGHQGENMTGIDYAESGFDYGKKFLPKAKFIKSTAEKLPFVNETFDLIIIMETLEHLEKWKLAINEAWRILAKNGILIITAPNGDIDNWSGHVNFWNEKEFEAILQPYQVKNIKKIDEGKTFIGIMEK